MYIPICSPLDYYYEGAISYFLLRGKDEEDSDIQDLVMSFSGLEEKVLAQYTFAKVWLNMV